MFVCKSAIRFSLGLSEASHEHPRGESKSISLLECPNSCSLTVANSSPTTTEVHFDVEPADTSETDLDSINNSVDIASFSSISSSFITSADSAASPGADSNSVLVAPADLVASPSDQLSSFQVHQDKFDVSSDLVVDHIDNSTSSEVESKSFPVPVMKAKQYRVTHLAVTTLQIANHQKMKGVMKMKTKLWII